MCFTKTINTSSSFTPSDLMKIEVRKVYFIPYFIDLTLTLRVWTDGWRQGSLLTARGQ